MGYGTRRSSKQAAIAVSVSKQLKAHTKMHGKKHGDCMKRKMDSGMTMKKSHSACAKAR